MLVIVDMQDFFRASHAVALQVVEACRAAMANSEKILILEYAGYGPTTSVILNVLKNQDYEYEVSTKDRDDGSGLILDFIKRNGLGNEPVKVCGVNGGCCVADTVIGLLADDDDGPANRKNGRRIKRRRKVTVLGEATCCFYSHDWSLELGNRVRSIGRKFQLTGSPAKYSHGTNYGI